MGGKNETKNRGRIKHDCERKKKKRKLEGDGVKYKCCFNTSLSGGMGVMVIKQKN